MFIYTNANLLARIEHEEVWVDEQEVPGVDKVLGAYGNVLDSFDGHENEIGEEFIHNYG